MKILLCLALLFSTPFIHAVETQQTLSILKPNAVRDNHIGEIAARFERAGLKIIAAKMTRLTPDQAKEFYAVHAKRSFFNELVTYISSGPIVALVLQGEDAIALNRKLMGATNPKEAAKGTIRADFARSIEENAVHGSDSLENAKREIAFFFKPDEIYPH